MTQTTKPFAYVRSLWSQCLRPLSTDPNSAFSERVIRSTFVVLVAMWLILDITFPLLRLGPSPITDTILRGFALIFTYWSLRQQRITLAGMGLFGYLFTTLARNLFAAYWVDLNFPLVILLCFIAGVVFPVRILPIIGAGLWSVVVVVVIVQSNAGIKPPPDFVRYIYLSTPFTTIASHGFAILGLMFFLTFLRREVERIYAGLQESVNKLEIRVQERTHQLDQAKAQTERLYTLSKQINAVQSYEALLEAIALSQQSRSEAIALSVFDDFNMQNAKEFQVLAVVQADTVKAVNPGLHFDSKFLTYWTKDEVFVVENMLTSDNIDEASRQFFMAANTQALISARLMLGERVLGALTFSLPAPHQYGAEERAFVRSVADIVASAVDRIRLYLEQVATSEKLREVDQIKSQFLASMSHELRTPLNAVLNFTEFVSLGMLGTVNDAQKDALSKAVDSGRHLLALINDVLDMTKIEAGMMNLFIEDNINLNREIDSVIAAGRTMLKDRDVTFVEDIDPALPLVRGDRRRIRQILLNLVSNACKFTEQGSVTLTVKVKPNAQQSDSTGEQTHEILFTVRDTGPGIDPNEHAVIFEPFRQTEHGIQHANGTGLGLPITKRLVEAHGGRLWLESERGRGATFFVALPIHAQTQVAETAK
jgi:signal transduction histidine kinase